MTDSPVVDQLVQAYNAEVETVLNYLANSIALEGIRAEQIKEELQADIEEELAHAQQLGKRLDELDAKPPASFDLEMSQTELQLPEDTTDVVSVIDGVIQAENDAIDGYRTLIRVAQAEEDYVTEDLAVQLLAGEEAHLSEFRSYRREYEE